MAVAGKNADSAMRIHLSSIKPDIKEICKNRKALITDLLKIQLIFPKKIPNKLDHYMLILYINIYLATTLNPLHF